MNQKPAISFAIVICMIAFATIVKAQDPRVQSNAPSAVVKTDTTEQIFEMGLQEQPSFPGGWEACRKYLDDSIKYPKQAIDVHVQGTVYIRMVIHKDGSISDVKIVNDRIGYGCGEEAVRVVSRMPRWKPGKLNGASVSARYTMPVKFTLH